MRRNFKGLLAAAATLGLLMAESTGFAADLKERNLKVAFQNSEGSAQYEGAKRLADLVSQKSGSKIKIKLFPGGALGKDTAVVSAEQQLGPLDCLVNNAGVSVLSRGDLLEVSPESYDRCLNINTRGTFFLTQAFARRLVARPPGEGHRSIITITSTNARAASITRGEYCVSKAALSMASLLFAVRLANEGIGVYEVLPGTTETEMAAASKAYYDKKIEEGLTAISRWGRPKEIGRVVVTLAQGGLPYTVGQAIQVDGGTLICKY